MGFLLSGLGICYLFSVILSLAISGILPLDSSGINVKVDLLHKQLTLSLTRGNGLFLYPHMVY